MPQVDISGIALFNSMKSKTTNAALMAAIPTPVAGESVPIGTYASASVNRRRSIKAAQIRPLRRQSFPAWEYEPSLSVLMMPAPVGKSEDKERSR